ncbi:RDD family protein [Terribacillus sp. 7520-G]|uniref:RDD family protein n=1 Tax=Terribacillus TaxID=459532 RepID=UPI001E5B23FB|nr:RDD family protein [Terribacillus sp. 7520-G]
MDKEKREHPEELTSPDQDISSTGIPEAAESDRQTESDALSDMYQGKEKLDEEAMEQPGAASPAAVADKRYAGFWMRFWAYLVDLIVVFSLTGLLVQPFTMIDAFYEATLWIWSVSALLGGVIFFAYFLFMTKWRGQTLGKMIFGLRVIRKDGGGLSWSDTLIREVVGRFIHRLLFLTILYVVVAFTPRKQGVHDFFADTLVIHE